MLYDLIVIGDDLSSHASAALASHNGMKTVLLSETGMEQEICLNGDLFFNLDPTPVTGFGLNQSGSSLLERLNITIERTLLNPAYQIILPGHRLDFFNDKESLVREMVREFPEPSAEITSLYDAVEKHGVILDQWVKDHPFIRPRCFQDGMDYFKHLFPHLIKYKYDNSKLKNIMFRNPSFKKVIEAQNALLSFKTKGPESIFSYFQFSSPLRGVYHFPNGKKDLFDSLIKKIESTNGLCHRHCEISSISKDKIIEVNFIDKNGVASKIETTNLIASTKWQNIHLLLERKKKFKLDDFIRPIEVSYLPFTIHLGIRHHSVPEKMARHIAVITDVNKNTYDNNLIILESNSHEDSRNNVPEKNLLTATVFLQDDQLTWSKENLTASARSIIDRLEFFLPFLKENIEFFDIKESIGISQKQKNILNPKYQLQNSFIFGLAAKSNTTSYSNIYLTGASLLTDIGFEGEIISGINAVTRIAGKDLINGI